jgi:nuclear transport factor 2 (NTF2) superfamily protein
MQLRVLRDDSGNRSHGNTIAAEALTVGMGIKRLAEPLGVDLYDAANPRRRVPNNQLLRYLKGMFMPNLTSNPTVSSKPADPTSARPPLPPFTLETAIQKVRLAEDGWNSRDPEKAALGYSLDSRWRNRSEFLNGRAEIIAFLKRKWAKELEYRLIKELWAFSGNRIAVRFAYEWCDDSGKWFRSYGNENWEFDEYGLNRARHACINDLAIRESERKYHWPLGRRPDGHPELSDFGF